MSDGAWQLLLVVTVAGLVIEGIVLLGVLRQMGALLLQLGPTIPGEVEEGPDLGTIVAPVIAPRDMPTILLFVAPTCSLCKPIVEALPTLRRHYRNVRITPVVTGEDPVRRETYASKIQGARTDLDHLYNDWEIPGTPFAIAVRLEGTVRSRAVVNSLPQLETLAGALLAPMEHDEVEERLHIHMQRSTNEDGRAKLSQVDSG